MINIKDLKNKLVAILGFGLEGRTVTRYLTKHGIKPVLFDQRPWEQWPADEQAGIKNLEINFIFGPDAFKELAGFDVVFRSPGIKITQLTINNLQLTSQTRFFFEHCPAKIIGVTGTKGKGTTSALIYEMLKADGRKVYLTGNIGKIQPLDILDDLSENDWVVYELSSFQLQDLDRSPYIGVVLMITEEHLDYHKDQKEYLSAKEAIVKYQTAQDYAVINADFESSMKIGSLGKAQKTYFSRKAKVENGCFVGNDEISHTEHGIIVKAGDVQLRGEHNLENICAATAAAVCAGCRVEAIKQAIVNFKGLEHRLEFVAEKNGVKYYNDSFSTTPETAIAGITSFAEPLIAILGGSSKNSNFSELGKTINQQKNIKGLILIGQEAKKIKQATSGFKGQILEGADSMKKIFEQIKSVANHGDVVLLSPACASFDMFKNYKVRGEQFKQQVQAL